VLLALLPGHAQGAAQPLAREADALRVEVPDTLLERALDDESVAIVTAALRLVNLPGSRGRVRALLAHQDWQVRVQAAKALGRIGDRGDVDRLAALLGDREWWVRYRAAEALVDLPWLARADLAALHASLTDRYAADMLSQAMAEERRS
jgi:HEAT repeat protein